MSIFSSINNSLPPQAQVKARQLILSNLRSQSKNPPLSQSNFFKPLLFDLDKVSQINCENLVGQISLPVGIAGPLSATLVTDSYQTTLGGLLIPLATTEGALVASINRGCKLLNEAGTTIVTIKNVGMTRAPVFKCQTSSMASQLATWIKTNKAHLGSIGVSTSHHLKFLDCQVFIKENLVFARFAFQTGEAMGMNMVTLATAKIVSHVIKQHTDVTCLALSSNVCTDKKPSSLTRRLGRGRWVKVTCTIPNILIQTILKTTPLALMETYHAKVVVGSRLAGLAGRNMQIANVASAILAATGQDIAHTVDISQGSLALRQNHTSITAKLSLPTVPVGTVGGGTWLETQATARTLISDQLVTPDILATIIGLGALAGELSGLASLSSNSLAASHLRLGRTI